MRHYFIFILFFPIGLSNADDKSALKGFLGVPPIQQFELPPVPTISDLYKTDERQQESESATSRGSQSSAGTPVSFSKNTLFYTRRKEGDGFISVSAERDSFVKIVDWDTKRLEAYLWIRRGTTYNHDYAPDSYYMVFFVQDVIETPNGELIGKWFGKTAEPFFVGSGRRTRLELGVSSRTHRIITSEPSDFMRFSPPKR